MTVCPFPNSKLGKVEFFQRSRTCFCTVILPQHLNLFNIWSAFVHNASLPNVKICSTLEFAWHQTVFKMRKGQHHHWDSTNERISSTSDKFIRWICQPFYSCLWAHQPEEIPPKKGWERWRATCPTFAREVARPSWSLSTFELEEVKPILTDKNTDIFNLFGFFLFIFHLLWK